MRPARVPAANLFCSGNLLSFVRLPVLDGEVMPLHRKCKLRKIIAGTLLSMAIGLIGAAAPASQDMNAAPPAPAVTGTAMVQLAQQAAQRFEYPLVHGANVDWCAQWAQGCGWPGAHQFCRMRGFAHATGYATFQPGRTYVVGSDQFCNGSVCKAFRYVACASN